ncbi:MAG: D-alanyl-D-alanine carboxypeptidase/D-alanyl-D-alanine-endopeptidase [Prevotellaceae bacterium]|jgi:D-alanyl-D-alanine carboxypeptidase/D-alanyl-D-alanine-endopeptidase (penicillin-binding protein 4)|nr:D-alanyl-D-alanine carboxypeptidase/D-alanyl-D-alanine-endopeptidase [Prevotellaceae bacterium]
MKYKLLSFILLFIIPFQLFSQISAEKKLRDCVESLCNDKKLKGSLFSMKLINCETGATVFEYQPDRKLIPASIQKLLTAGIALENLGKNHVFSTTVSCDGYISADSSLYGNVYIAGGGDPTFCSEKFLKIATDTLFEQILSSFFNAGFYKINGKIIIDDSYFNGKHNVSEPVHPSWEWEDIGNYYGAGVYGLNFNENTFTVKVSCSDNSVIDMHCEYPCNEHIMSQLVTDINIVSRDSSANFSSASSFLSSNYLIYGEIPVGQTVEINCSMQNPAEVFTFWFNDYLHSRGITVKNEITAQSSEKYVIYEIKSPKLSSIAKSALHTSNNLFSDAIFRNLARHKTEDPSFSGAAKTLTKLLKNHKLNVDDIHIVDGSGLSRHNLLTANFMCDYLREIKRSIPDFNSYLPSPGSENSTLKYFMSNYSGKNRIFLKSGSMTGVLNYAGYIVGKNGATMCLTVMTNNFLCKTRDLRPKLEHLISLAAEL